MSKARKKGFTNLLVGQTVTFNKAYEGFVAYSLGIQPKISEEEIIQLDEELWKS